MRRWWRRITVQILLRLSANLLLVRSAESGVLTLVGPHRRQHLLFAIDKVCGIQRGNLKSVPVGDRVGRTSLHAVSAEDAAVVIDVIDLGVALGARDTLLSRVLSRLDINAVRRTGGGAEKAGHAFFQAVLIALQNVDAAEALLKFCAFERPWTVGIVLDDGRLEHLAKGNAHSFGDSGNVFQ